MDCSASPPPPQPLLLGGIISPLTRDLKPRAAPHHIPSPAAAPHVPLEHKSSSGGLLSDLERRQSERSDFDDEDSSDGQLLDADEEEDSDRGDDGEAPPPVLAFTIPDLVDGAGAAGTTPEEGLSKVAPSALRQCLRPVLGGLERLDALALLQCEPLPSSSATPARGAVVGDG